MVGHTRTYGEGTQRAWLACLLILCAQGAWSAPLVYQNADLCATITLARDQTDSIAVGALRALRDLSVSDSCPAMDDVTLLVEVRYKTTGVTRPLQIPFPAWTAMLRSCSDGHAASGSALVVRAIEAFLNQLSLGAGNTVVGPVPGTK